jgi:D-serine deaminase-like pyridoxal phosphate-dependent protein
LTRHVDKPYKDVDQCYSTGKMKLTKSQAKSMAKRMQKTTGLRIDAFYCYTCHKYHVGKRPRNPKTNTHKKACR